MALPCSQCGAHLKMTPQTMRTALLLIIGLAFVLTGGVVFGVRSAADAHAADSVLIAGAIVGSILFAVPGAVAIRLILWNKRYDVTAAAPMRCKT
jgi:hypothetical protein